MITLGWFDWINVFPIWAQIIIATLIGMACFGVITMSIMGIKKIIEYWEKFIDDIDK